MVGVGPGRAGDSVVFGAGAFPLLWPREGSDFCSSGGYRSRAGFSGVSLGSGEPLRRPVFWRLLFLGLLCFGRSRGGGSFRLTAGGARFVDR